MEGKKTKSKTAGFSRRGFLKRTEGVAIRTAVGGAFLKLIWLDDSLAAIPASGGYLLVDTRKCQGCMTCMLACSLVHEGKENLSLARIQVVQNSFGKFPNDIELAQCRQCKTPACVQACPTRAIYAEGKYGNVRMVDAKKCTGCMACLNACPHTPGRAIWDFEDEHAQKCDLCANTPFWNERGGPGGKQACVELCPVAALKFTKEMPEQVGDEGYNVNLRGEGWKNLGFSIDSEGSDSDKLTEARPAQTPYAGRYDRHPDLGPDEGKEKESEE
ncbi:MAG: 4Fe-4S dicluster domain-containing protein [Planctomycetota bacterium]|jgi:Fe-S-cluster-containing dehydrogenase component